ncbi:MAG: alkaline phosphatase [Planctomycetaceae bacterium]
MRARVITSACVACLLVGRIGAETTESIVNADPIAGLQREAETDGVASWGYWGDRPDRHVSWSNHSNRLIPVYSFGISLDSVARERSLYRDADRLRELYGRLPDETLAPHADYFDQTDVHRLQVEAADLGKKRIVLVVFDGMDWTLTRAAAVHRTGRVDYKAGRGSGLSFQDYRGTVTDFGFCVTSPANDGTTVDVDAQAVRNPGGRTPGGYNPVLGGATPWDPSAAPRYLMGRDRECPHAVTDSAASATSLCAGRKTYNDAINVDPEGRPLEPVARLLQRRGFAVGAVTSVPVSHATPACSYANNVSRDDYQDISRDLVGAPSAFHRDKPLPGMDLLVGCGFGVDVQQDADQGSNFESGNKYVAESTLATIDAGNGGRYRMATRTPGSAGRDVLAEAARHAAPAGERLFGFFGTPEGNLPFQTADGRFDPVVLPEETRQALEGLKRKYSPPLSYAAKDIEENPTLADMAVVALDFLADRGPFWLMVEAGDVDWAAHGNNIDNCLGSIHGGDAAFAAIVDWIERHGGWDDTVVIVTSDHGHMFVLTDPVAFASR